MNKRYVQGVLCVIAILHLYFYSPSKVEGSIGEFTSAIYYMTWEIKRLIQIPVIYGFLILAVHFFWRSRQTASDLGQEDESQTGKQAK